MTHNPNDDETRVLPPAPAPAPVQLDDGDATVFKPLHGQAAGEGTATRSTSQRMGHSWRHIADLAQGEGIGLGSVLKGRFLMERELGRGGMGVVYLARDERKVEARDRDPYVAVKVLNDEFRKHPDALVTLQRESRRSQQLGNDHIVRVYDFDKDGTNVFMTMEYVQGDDLRTLIRTRARDGMPFADAWPLIAGMGEALLRAHGAGIVHSDFKPGNVMVTPDGVAKVFDFGIARAGQIGHGQTDGDRTVFDAGTLGAMTPAYASLEMLQGKAPTPSDDIYAFACVVVELLTGRHPFDKQSAEEAMAAGCRPPVVAGLDKRQYKTLCDALAFSAEKRTSDIADVITGLRKRHWRDRATPWLLASVALAALLVVGAWFVNLQVERRHVDDTLRRFAPGQADHFSGEDDVRQALAALDGDERRRVVVDGADVIDGFLVRLVATHWDPAAGRYDYAGAQAAFRLRRELKTFAPRLDRRRDEVIRERDAALNRLDTALSQAILANRLFGAGQDEVPAILTNIRSIDGSSRLLTSPELELKFAAAIDESVAAANKPEAERRLVIAQRWYPDSPRLATLAERVTAMASTGSTAAPPTVSPAAASSTFAPALREAEQVSRLESLRSASAAGDLDKAVDSFHQLRAGAGGVSNSRDEAADLLAGAYLDAARAACSAGHWKDAADKIAMGLATIGERPDLDAASTRYQLALAIMTAAKAPTVAQADQEALRHRLDAVKSSDPDGLKDLEAAMAASRALPEGSLNNVLKKLRAVPAVAVRADPCARRGLAGSGRECFDTFSARAHGPALVVLPADPKPLAMTRTEITVADLDQYCRSTRACVMARGLASDEPARSITVALAQRYATWLSQVSGHVYRLPSEDEWLYAARANSAWDSKTNNCGPATTSLGRLFHKDAWSSKGMANPWGLVDMTGSVWEWTTKKGGLVAHGGSYRSGPDQCSVSSVRASNGSAERDVGFRLVRELK